MLRNLRLRVAVPIFLFAAAASVFSRILEGGWLSLVAVLAATMGAALLVARFWWRGELRAIDQLVQGMAGLTEAGRAEPILETPLGELGGVVEAFNRMASTLGLRLHALESQRSQLEIAFATGGDAMLAIDRTGRVVYLNPAASRLFGRDMSEATGADFIRVVRDHEIFAMLQRVLERRQRESAVVDYGPARQYLQVTVIPLPAGGDWAAVASFTDLTEVRRLESVRREFVSNVSHELRTPLASIKAAVETLEAGAIEETAVARDFLRRVDGEVDRLTELVEELMEISRLESGALPMKPERCDARGLLQEAVRRMISLALRAGLSLTFEEHGNVPDIEVDVERVKRAVMNLIHNAVKFTPSGGRVAVWADADADGVSLHVADTGVGIAQEDQARVFERFYKADRARSGGGSGLGLAIVKHVAQAHGGSVSVRSAVGQGAEFTITLPVAAEVRPQHS